MLLKAQNTVININKQAKKSLGLKKVLFKFDQYKIPMQNNPKQTSQCRCGNKFQTQGVSYCEQCTFLKSIQLSQEIIRLRKKLKLYQNKNKQIQSLANKQQKEQFQILLSQTRCHLDKRLASDDQVRKQLDYLNDQLSRIQKQVEGQKLAQKQCVSTILGAIEQVNRLQRQQAKNERLYSQLSRHYNDQVVRKKSQLERLKSLLQKTNFITMIYSISFQDNNCFLNGQKIISDNCWKIIQIVSFYHHRYKGYRPLVQISFDSMQMYPCQLLLQQVRHGQENRFFKFFQEKKSEQHQDPIEISCQDEQIILSKWMPFIVAEMKNLFQFILKQSGVGYDYKLKYQVGSKGQFELVKLAKDLKLIENFTLTIKCLMTDIQQINRLQFFARQNRLEMQKNRKI